MKKITSLILMLCICLSTLLVLTSCGSSIPAGTYKGVLGDEIEISGKTMKMSAEISGETYSIVYTYELGKNDKDEEIITATFEKVEYSGDNEIVKGFIAEIEKEYAKETSNTSSFEQGEGYFKIDGAKYTKQ